MSREIRGTVSRKKRKEMSLGRQMTSVQNMLPHAAIVWIEKQRREENCPRCLKPFSGLPLLRGHTDQTTSYKKDPVCSAPPATL